MNKIWLYTCGIIVTAIALGTAYAGSGTTGVFGQASPKRVSATRLVYGPFVATPASENDWGEVTLPAYTGSAPLQKVRMTMKWHIGYQFQVENTDGTDWWNAPLVPHFYSFPWIWSTDHNRVVTANLLPSCSIFLCNYDLETFDGVIDYAGSSGIDENVSWNICLQPDYWTTQVCEITDPWTLQRFLDTDNVLNWSIRPMSHISQVAGIDVPTSQSLNIGQLRSEWSVIVQSLEYNPQ